MTRAALLASLINSSNTLTAVDFTDTGNTVFGDASVDTLTINGTNVSIPNNLNIGANTFFINSSNNRVGINTTLPLNALDVTGNVSVTGSITESNLNLQGGNNLLIYSQDFANAAWTKSSSATATAATFIAPDGTLTGQTCTFPSSSYIAQSFTVAGIYTFSIYCHIISTNWVCIENYNSPLDKAVWFNLSTGVVGTQSNATGTISSVGNGWYKCSITMTAVSTNISIFNFFTVTADNSFTRSGSVYAWGAQLELGTVASAYTPTTTAAITTTNNLYVPSGQVIVQSGGTSAPSYSFAGKTTSGMYFGNGPSIAYGGALIVSFGGQTGYDVSMTQGATLKWGSAAGQTTGTDIALERDAANILAQRNSTNAQTFRLYNTYTDASNYERLSVDWTTTANTATIGTQAAGTGTNRTFVLSSASAYLQFSAAGAVRVVIDNAATAMYPQVNNSYDLGYSTLKWRNAYIAGVVTTNSDASINGVTVGRGNSSVSTNTVVGTSAGLNISTASGVTATGLSALQYNTTGNSATAYGYQSLINNYTGSNNVGYGALSLYYNTTAGNLTSVGHQALYSNTTNVATLGTITGGSSYTNGTYTGVVMTLSSGSTALTYPTATIVVSGGAVTTVTITSAGVGFKDTTTVLTAPAASIGGTGSGFTVPVATLASGTGNVAVGYQAGYTNSTGVQNTFTGYQAGYSQTTAAQNTLIGNSAGYLLTTGSYNTVTGLNALYNSIVAQYNCAYGQLSLTNNTSNNNCAFGVNSLYANTSGNNNSAFGHNAGRGTTPQTTGSTSTYIGYQAYAGATNATNETVIGANAVGLGSNTTVIGNSSTTATYLPAGFLMNQNQYLQGGNNYVVYANDLSQSAWLIQGSASKTATTVTVSANADRVIQTVGNIFGASAQVGLVYTVSATLSGTGTIGFTGLMGNGTLGTANTVTLTATPTRYSFTVTNTSSGVNCGPAFYGAGSSITATVANVQMEIGTQVSNFTPTTTASVTTTNNISVPSGQVFSGGGSTSAPGYSFIGYPTSGFYNNAGQVWAYENGTLAAKFAASRTITATAYAIGFLEDTIITRDAANTLAQRNSTNAQTFRLYNTYTDASNYERLSVDWSTNANTATISTQNAGTGSARNLAIGQDLYVNGVRVGKGGGSLATNTVIGAGALSATDTAGYSVAIGNSALNGQTSGGFNVAIGSSAMSSNQTGGTNIAIGYLALQQGTAPSNNTMVGYTSGRYTTNQYNCGFGAASLGLNTTAPNLTAIGAGSLQNNTTNVATLGSITGGTGYTDGTYTGVVMTLSSGSTAITYPTATIVVAGGAVTTVTLTSNGVGFKDTTTVLTAPAASIGGTGSGFSVPVATLQSGTGNVAVGYQAGYSNSIGTNNTFNGYQAGYSNSTGISNSYFGQGAGYANSSGNYNAGFGQATLNGNTTGVRNSGCGQGALYSNSTGGSNVGIGYLAGYGNGTNANTTGSNNTFIGNETVGSANNNTNSIVIGYQAVGLGSNTTVIGNSSTTRTKVFGAIESSGYTVATLPTPSIGMQTYVTDGDSGLAWGATVVNSGSGATKYLVWYNGTNWTVVGK